MTQEKIENILIAAIAVIVLGTLAVPAILAAVYGWHWMLVYPALLVALIVWAKERKAGGNDV